MSKSKSKSNHKHNNMDCLLIVDDRPYIASYCTVCGKIRRYCFYREEMNIDTKLVWRI